MRLPSARSKGRNDSFVTDHRADAQTKRAENAHPPRRVFHRLTKTLGKALTSFLVVAGNAVDFFSVLELADHLINVIAKCRAFGLNGGRDLV
jgi:hypothetical protein